MFETGRWRRYHSELAFLENIQEAKRAVQTWRAIATGEDVAAAAASVTSAFGWSPATLSRIPPRQKPQTTRPQTMQPQTMQPQTLQPQTLQPKAVHIAPETAVPVRLDPTPNVLAEIVEAPIAPVAPVASIASFLQTFSPPAAEIVAAPERVVEFTFSLDGIEAKYPLLRNTL